jgi:hypothetical protein
MSGDRWHAAGLVAFPGGTGNGDPYKATDTQACVSSA